MQARPAVPGTGKSRRPRARGQAVAALAAVYGSPRPLSQGQRLALGVVSFVDVGRVLLFLWEVGEVGGGECFEGQAEGGAVGHPAAEALADGDGDVAVEQ